jgi:predicted PhzF superfamily epimerase YddE/YHI9
MGPSPKYIENKLMPSDIVKSLGIESGYISSNFSIRIINAGLKTLIIPIINLEKCLQILPK